MSLLQKDPGINVPIFIFSEYLHWQSPVQVSRDIKHSLVDLSMLIGYVPTMASVLLTNKSSEVSYQLHSKVSPLVFQFGSWMHMLAPPKNIFLIVKNLNKRNISTKHYVQDRVSPGDRDPICLPSAPPQITCLSSLWAMEAR
jgi:hypothetical protein